MSQSFNSIPHRSLARRLQSRLQRSYALEKSQIVISSGLTIEFTRVADPDVVLDQVAERADRVERTANKRLPEPELHLPYWAELWDSALGVARWLAREERETRMEDGERRVGPAEFAPSSILHPPSSKRCLLDLGCGMGLVGTVAAAIGYDVTFVDVEPPALLFARLNSLPFAERVREIRRLNWQTDTLSRTFGTIAGADILYERQQWEHLEPFWHAHLAPGGRVILGEPGRQTGDLFGDWILTRGWSLVRHELKVETRERPIRIFEIKPEKQIRMAKPEIRKNDET